MEETISLIFHGLKKVKELELNLPNYLANQPPHLLSSSLEEIITIFVEAKERLVTSHESSSQRVAMQNIDASLQEWVIRSGETKLLGGKAGEVSDQIMCRKDLDQGCSSTPFRNSNVNQAMEVSDSGKLPITCSSLQRPRRRQDEEDRRTVRVAAPRMGNTDIPPDDNFSWRKYGQKEILGSRFPRAYYRCTHQKLYNCPAKKQVQRLDDDPYMFLVTYRGSHSCYTSAAAVPTTSTEMIIATTTTTGITTTDQSNVVTTSTSGLSLNPLPLDRWLSVQVSVGGSSLSHRYDKETEYAAGVVDMADAMFNSGSSGGNNTMEFIFPSQHPPQS
ncbi:WRKY transcription factor 55 isoform X2 [Carica papaya]|uniref:WRKY transcription factor 55 isoform X2 n=1 Tax=Carica papaya TaxID=3649 RepID=UPI000B8C88ED|nr:WRKY transcription factor 55 isoform X2 [Carica papaya]